MNEYVLTPGNDPTSFRESKDGETYHLCDFPGHIHSVPFPFTDCCEPGEWTWESRYAR